MKKLILLLLVVLLVGCNKNVSSNNPNESGEKQTTGFGLGAPDAKLEDLNPPHIFSMQKKSEIGFENITSEESLPQPRVKKDGKLLVGWLVEELTFESFNRVLHHGKIEMKHRGWDWIEVTDAREVDKQRDAIANFINKNVDAIVINYAQMEPIGDLIIDARKKGIGVYCIDNSLAPGVVCTSTMYNGVAGARMFYYGAEKLNYRGNVLLMNEARPCIYQERLYSAEGLMKLFPQMKLISHVGCKNMEEWFTKGADYVTKYKDRIDWLFGYADIEILQAVRAFEQAGLTRKDVFATGMDGGVQIYDILREDKSIFIATLSQPFEAYCHSIYEVIDQIQVKGIGIGDPKSIVPMGRGIYHNPVVTTKGTVPPKGSVIHEVFIDGYYNPEVKTAWYFWGDPYKI